MQIVHLPNGPYYPVHPSWDGNQFGFWVEPWQVVLMISQRNLFHSGARSLSIFRMCSPQYHPGNVLLHWDHLMNFSSLENFFCTVNIFIRNVSQ